MQQPSRSIGDKRVSNKPMMEAVPEEDSLVRSRAEAQQAQYWLVCFILLVAATQRPEWKRNQRNLSRHYSGYRHQSWWTVFTCELMERQNKKQLMGSVSAQLHLSLLGNCPKLTFDIYWHVCLLLALTFYTIFHTAMILLMFKIYSEKLVLGHFREWRIQFNL